MYRICTTPIKIICYTISVEIFFQVNSDIDFICGVDDLVRETASSAKRTQPLFYYQFSYDGALGFYKKKLGIDRTGDKNAQK